METVQEKLIPIKTVCDISGRSRAQIYRDMKTGAFPASVQISAQCVRWSLNEINAWIEARKNERTKTHTV